MSRPVNLHTPAPGAQLRAQVLLQGPLAVEVRALAEHYQLEPAALIRLLVTEALDRRREAA